MSDSLYHIISLARGLTRYFISICGSDPYIAHKTQLIRIINNVDLIIGDAESSGVVDAIITTGQSAEGPSESGGGLPHDIVGSQVQAFTIILLSGRLMLMVTTHINECSLPHH